MPRTSPYSIVLTEDERRHLEAAARRYTSPYRDVVRARVVLYAAEGLGNDEIAARLDTPPQVVLQVAQTVLWPAPGRAG
jgi:DNA-directed RNA polymerase specialized sigma24 family protein